MFHFRSILALRHLQQMLHKLYALYPQFVVSYLWLDMDHTTPKIEVFQNSFWQLCLVCLICWIFQNTDTIHVLNCKLCKIETTPYRNCSAITIPNLGHICKPQNWPITIIYLSTFWQVGKISSICLLKRISENLNCEILLVRINSINFSNPFWRQCVLLFASIVAIVVPNVDFW